MNFETQITSVEFERSESKCCVKVDAYEMFTYNTDVGYLLVSEMGHMAMLHSN